MCDTSLFLERVWQIPMIRASLFFSPWLMGPDTDNDGAIQL